MRLSPSTVLRAGCAALSLLLVAAAAPAPKSPSKAPIGIVINGEVLSIDPPPRFERNLLYVPVRRTMEALGLAFNRSGNHITTQVGAKSVTLTIGSRAARVDTNEVLLEGPLLEIKDVLYVPLRFFTDVLGAQAQYDRRHNTVSIVAQLVGRSTNGLVPVAGGFARFGTVVAVDVLSNPPTITLGSNGSVKTVPVGANAAIDVEDVNVGVTTPGELGDIRPGDFARIEMQKDGRVQRVVDEYGSRNGHIIAIGSGQFVLDDGQVISAGRTTEISLNGKAASYTDLRPNDQVSVRYNVETNEVRSVLASRKVVSAAQRLQISNVQAQPDRPLRAGDTDSGRASRHAGRLRYLRYRIGRHESNDARESRRRLYRKLRHPARRELRRRRADRAALLGRRDRAGGGAADGLCLGYAAGHLRFCPGLPTRRSIRIARPSTQALRPTPFR